VARPCLLLVPSFTELEWGIRPRLEEWADVASFDMPGVGDEPLPAEVEPDPDRAAELLGRWREAGVRRAVAEVDRRRWDRYFVVTDDGGAATSVRVASRNRRSVLGLAM